MSAKFANFVYFKDRVCVWFIAWLKTYSIKRDHKRSQSSVKGVFGCTRSGIYVSSRLIGMPLARRHTDKRGNKPTKPGCMFCKAQLSAYHEISVHVKNGLNTVARAGKQYKIHPAETHWFALLIHHVCYIVKEMTTQRTALGWNSNIPV